MRYRFTKEQINVKQNGYNNFTLSVLVGNQLIEDGYLSYTKAGAIAQFQKEFGTYPKDYKPLAIYPVCNFGGLAIMEIEDGCDTYVYVADNYGDGYKNLTKNKIYYNGQGKPYFIRYRKRYYLDDFLKV